jgi:hypothetical protein
MKKWRAEVVETSRISGGGMNQQGGVLKKIVVLAPHKMERQNSKAKVFPAIVLVADRKVPSRAYNCLRFAAMSADESVLAYTGQEQCYVSECNTQVEPYQAAILPATGVPVTQNGIAVLSRNGRYTDFLPEQLSPVAYRYDLSTGDMSETTNFENAPGGRVAVASNARRDRYFERS